MKVREWFANLIGQIVSSVIGGIVLAVILSLIESKGKPLPIWSIIIPAFVIAAVIFFMLWLLFRYVFKKSPESETSIEEVPSEGEMLSQVEKPDFARLLNLIEPELRKLKEELGGGQVGRQKRFKPDVVLGVLSEELVGGCIIGALLASPSFLTTKNFYPIFYHKESSKGELFKEFKKDVKEHKWKNFLLVDDDSQSGKTIETVYKELTMFLPRDAKVKIAVVVIRHLSWYRYYNKFWKNDAVYCHPDVPMEHNVHWPWEA